MATKSPLTIKERLPGFGLAMHLYFDGKKLERVTYSILKAVQKGKEIITWTVDELYTSLKTEKEKKELENEVKQIYKFATGNEITDEIIKREYSL